MRDKITLAEMAELLKTTRCALFHHKDRGNIPFSPEIKDKVHYYDRAQILEWIATKPFKEYKPRRSKVKLKAFTYSGIARTVILFCQPNLLHRHNYE